MDTLEMALGVIVFGPMTDSLEGMQFAATKLRQAAALLEYRYAVERRYNETRLGEQTGDPTPAMQQAPAPAKRKRNRKARTAPTNGAATPPAGQPLFGQPTRTDVNLPDEG